MTVQHLSHTLKDRLLEIVETFSSEWAELSQINLNELQHEQFLPTLPYPSVWEFSLCQLSLQMDH